MAARELIDSQFDRAVEIVQSFPKTGPIQTGYEEKLSMYSLYKQATIGNVKAPRPGIWDMLGRAKWDAWAKHKDLDPYEAKWLYVDALLKVLRKYSDKTAARELVEELESYGGDPSNMVISGTLSKSRASDSSGSTASHDHPLRYSAQDLSAHPQVPQTTSHAEENTDGTNSEDETDDESHEHPAMLEHQNQRNRPQSSHSSHRYRTPTAGSLVMSPPPMQMSVPAIQPHPGFETQSAFAEPSPASGPSLFQNFHSYTGVNSPPSRDITSPQSFPGHASYRTKQPASLPGRQYPLPMGPTSRPALLEHAIENVQAHLASLHERLETLESQSAQPQVSNFSLASGGNSPKWRTGSRSPSDRHGDRLEWDWDDLGMWSLILNPMSRLAVSLRTLAAFFAKNENRSPSLIILRRLCLDVSFLLCVLAITRAIWRNSGVRRKEVKAALVVLWRAIVGAKKERVLVDRGV